MPGIVGLITKLPRERAERELLRMVATLHHESFYETGTWIDEAAGVYVGWSARKNSFSDGMPVRNENGDVVLVFSGDEFAEPGTTQRLKDRGHKFEAGGPSYLVHLCEEDSSFPANLNGRFHGLVTDRARNTAALFNDRYGMQRLYYYESKEAFYFAAEAKAILAVCPELRAADPRGLAEFIAYGCVSENRTLFSGLHLLPQAAKWIFENGSLTRKEIYFRPEEWEQQPRRDPETYYRELREVFSRNLPRYFNGRQPIGVSITGGLDTRMILAWHKAAPGALPCYTFGSMFRDCRDVTVGRKVAQLYQQPHEVIPVAQDFLTRFPHYAERSVYLTDACVDVSRAPDLYVQERAREIAPVRIAGTYGSEVLRGSRDFKPWEPSPGLFTPEVLAHVGVARESYAKLLTGHPVSFAVFRQAAWYHYGVLALEQTQLTVRSPFLDNDVVRQVFRAPDSALKGYDVSLRLIADGNTALSRIRTDRGLGSGPLSTAVARAFLEFTFKSEYAYDHGMPQWLSRVDHWFSPFRFERLFLGRHKFYHFRVWYRDALSNYVREMLLDPRTLSRPYLQRSGIEAIVTGHLKGDRNYTSEIHKVLTLELLHRLFIDAR